MARGISIQIKNAKRIDNIIRQLPENMKREADLLIEQEFKTAVQESRSIAKQHQFTGRLVSGISLRKGPSGFVYQSTAPYSAFAEFGIRGSVRITPGFERWAFQYKGLGKSGGRSAYDKILSWMIFRNIPEKYWYPVYMKLMGKGKWQNSRYSGHEAINSGSGFFLGPYIAAKGRVVKGLKGLLAKAIK